jgi:hypothetical protein
MVKVLHGCPCYAESSRDIVVTLTGAVDWCIILGDDGHCLNLVAVMPRSWIGSSRKLLILQTSSSLIMPSLLTRIKIKQVNYW